MKKDTVGILSDIMNLLECERELRQAPEFMNERQRVCLSGAAELLRIMTEDFASTMHQKFFSAEDWDWWNRMQLASSAVLLLEKQLEQRDE